VNTESRTLRETWGERAAETITLPAIRLMYWSIRRELWESRSIYIAPLSAAGVFFLGFLLSIFHLPAEMRQAAGLDPMHQREPIAMPYNIAAGLLMLTAIVVGVFYSLDALQGERRDRSIFFWKSLPISDRTVVLSKASIPILLLPLLTFGITFLLQLLMLLISSAVLLISGGDVAMLWTLLSFGRMSLLLLYHLVTVHGVSVAPIYGWLLFVSGWAPRAAFLWAILPPLAIGTLEKIVFGTSSFAAMIGDRVGGGGREAWTTPGRVPMDPTTHITLGHFVISPGLWIGLGVTALFLIAAVRLRRNQGPM